MECRCGMDVIFAIQGAGVAAKERAGAVEVSIVVPAYNEEVRLSRTLPVILDYLRSSGRSYEVIIVDDGSTDRTAELSASIARTEPRLKVISHERNSGKGRAVRTGVMAASGDYVIFTDADLSTPIDTVAPFLKILSNGADVVIGNRRMRESQVEVRQAPVRELIGRLYTLMSRALLGANVTDQACGFKGFTRRAAREIFGRQRVFGWAFDAESLYIAGRLGLRVHEEPVVWRHELGSKVKMARACVESFVNLFVIRWNGLAGKYR